MAQAVAYREQPKQEDVAVEDGIVSLNVNDEAQKKNRIQVSFTLILPRYLKQRSEVELSALGMAIPTLVTIVEILKGNGAAVQTKVITSTVDSKDEVKGKIVQKAKLEIFLERMNQKSSAEASTLDSKTETTSDETKSAANEPKN